MSGGVLKYPLLSYLVWSHLMAAAATEKCFHRLSIGLCAICQNL